jgi:hypothetical protein
LVNSSFKDQHIDKKRLYDERGFLERFNNFYGEMTYYDFTCKFFLVLVTRELMGYRISREYLDIRMSHVSK